MLDLKLFAKAITTLFLSKNKPAPSNEILDVWYKLLAHYETVHVCTAIKELCYQNTQYGISVGQIVEKIEGLDDIDHTAEQLAIDTLSRGGDLLKQAVEHRIITYEDRTTYMVTTSSTERRRIEERFKRAYICYRKDQVKKINIEEEVVERGLPEKG